VLERIDVLVPPGGDGETAFTQRVRATAEQLAPGVGVREVVVDPAEAARLGFRGVSTVHVNGREVGHRAHADEASTRTSPPDWMIAASIAHALEPRHLLFLCVANSARSQMAEGMARALAPPGVTVESAGSRPTEPRPEALAALREVGITPVGHRAKGLDEIDTDSIQLVVTLCKEEVCPTILRPVPQLHWPIDDPAAIEGDDATRAAAFAQARDEIRARLYVLFHG
jgi:arsenate reductase